MRPHKDILADFLESNFVAYRYLGNALGGRPQSKDLFSGGVADYEKIATQPDFHAALARIIEASDRHRIALMCAEVDPLDCHRCLLIGRQLAEQHIEIAHILPEGGLASQEQIENQLIETEDFVDSALLFRTRKERLAAAYYSRSRRVAYAENPRRVLEAKRA
jgi:hypothetical protein